MVSNGPLRGSGFLMSSAMVSFIDSTRVPLHDLQLKKKFHTVFILAQYETFSYNLLKQAIFALVSLRPPSLKVSFLLFGHLVEAYGRGAGHSYILFSLENSEGVLTGLP